MGGVEIKKSIYYVGYIDWNRRLFDELIPLPEGTSYNSYLIKGSEKVALIDTVDPESSIDLIEKLKELNIKNIDYIIANHAEQDHSGTIPKILELYPQAKVVTNAKCKSMLIDLLLINEDKFEVVADGDEISLGDKTLKFILTPFVHWPETMVTYLKEDKILFSCDLFGSHNAASNIFVDQEDIVYYYAKRYYAEIMMPFRSNIKSNLEKLKDLEIDIIAPSHGQVYNNPNFIINAYKEWISDNVKNKVVIPYTSMHGSVDKMVRHFSEALIERGITVKVFDISKSDLGEIAMEIVDAATIVMGSSTVLVGPHPSVVNVTYIANALRPKTKFISIIGSFGWGSKMVETISGMLTNFKAEVLEPVISKGYPKENEFMLLDKLADEILMKHKELNIM